MATAPVLFLIYNRPVLTARVFETIRKAQPRQLFIASDGAKNPEDRLKVDEARAIASAVEWDCEVKMLWRDANLGCGKAVTSAITWFFQQVEYGIILEDDCLVESSFFDYCTQLLAHYAQNHNVMVISAMSFLPLAYAPAKAYYFSNFSQIWGWATWKRAWNNLDFEMNGWEDFVQNKTIEEIIPDKKAQKFWIQYLQTYKDKNPNLWATRWWFSVWQARGLTIAPFVNLVQNIGFGQDGTNAKSAESWFANLPTQPIRIPLTHPKNFDVLHKADHFTYKIFFNRTESRAILLKNWLSRYLPLSLRLILKKVYNRLLKLF